MAEWDALDLVMERLMESDYHITKQERDSLYACESEVFWRSGAGVILATAAQIHVNPRALSTPLGFVLTFVSGIVGGRQAADPCLRQLLSMRQSLLALETRNALQYYAPERFASFHCKHIGACG